ncbi:LysR family transcriptional regulator [Streptomyces lydicus]|uniref:LysR family transcriptional regulator n=1 Tax=Streptomyces lydicus TaxID=47763 RepID=UPI0005276E21|nr:LysR substrate-binding domain-containing protein [Streptomyces lydicus]UEG94923.1 LysR family transcriptional regulator [Streptomyces lydicus]
MDLQRHLRHFLAVADALHFGRAAEELGMAQPPLSQSIRRLERELEVELFDRSGRRVALTAAGQALVPEARAMLAADRRLRARMAEVRAAAARPPLRVGLVPETPASVVRELLVGLTEQAPDGEVELREIPGAEQLRMLLDGRLDVGLLRHPVAEPELRTVPVAEERLGVVLPRLSALARQPQVALGELAGHDLVLFPRRTSPEWHDEVLARCGQGGYVPERVRAAESAEVLLALVVAGRGVGLLAEEAARHEPRVVWRRLAGEPLQGRVFAVRPTRSAHPLAARFAEVVARAQSDSGSGSGSGRPGTVGNLPGLAGIGDSTGPWAVVYDA